MSLPSVYINLEDDVSKVIMRLRRHSSAQVVLVCPKRCLLFSDSINLRLLKKQADLLGKEVFILTMDERGQTYAKEAGFALKFLPKVSAGRSVSDVRPMQRPEPPDHPPIEEEPPAEKESPAEAMSRLAKKIIAPSFFSSVKNLPQKESAQEAAPISPSPSQGGPVSPSQGGQLEPPPAEYSTLPEAAAVKVEDREFEPLEVKSTESFFPAEIEEEYKDGQKKSAVPKIILGVLTLSIVVALLLYFIILPKAAVVVYPKTEVITRDMQISMSAAAQNIDVNKLILPAVKVGQTVNVSDKFQSQGQNQIGNKASGTVKIYNFTKVPISLKAATTVLTVGSKTYSLVNDVTALKPTQYTDARTKEVDPSSLGDSVDVAATAGGDDYNLPSGTRMEISNQVFGSRPLQLYAKTDSEITGGTTRYLSVILPDDVTKAEAQLQQEALAQVRQKLQESGEVLAEGSYSITVSQFSTDNPAGTQTPGFQGSLTANIVGLGFKQDDLDNLINQRIGQTLASNKTLQQPTPDESTYTIQNLDLNNLLATLQAHFQGLAVFGVDLNGVAGELKGKTAAQANDILNAKGEIQKVEITLAPVWQKTFPWFSQKISLTVAQPE